MIRQSPIKALTIALLLIALLGFAIPALAGGWAVVTLADLPEGIVAGEPFQIEFTVLQHGKMPWVFDNVLVLASQSGGETVIVKAKANPAIPGRYTAELNLPQPGRWSWYIQSGLAPERQTMPDLEVAGPAAAVPAGVNSVSYRLAIGIAALAAAGALGLLLRRRQPFLAATALVLCVALSVFAFSQAAGAARAASDRVDAETKIGSPLAPAELGKQLFLAKGCVVCHVNQNAGGSRGYSLDVGPDLTQIDKDARYLQAWLADPSAVKPDTMMPELELSQDEIEALVAFLDPPVLGE